MQSVFDPVAPITAAIDTLTTSLTSVASPALAVGAGILALGFGWRLVRRFAK